MWVAALGVLGLAVWCYQAPAAGCIATEGAILCGDVNHSTIKNTVDQENPATLLMVATVFGAKDASEEKRRQAEAKSTELAKKFGFTSAAVIEFFKVLGYQKVPEERIAVRLVEIAKHFEQTRKELGALTPDNLQTAELADLAKQALEAGRLSEADAMIERAKEAELSALRHTRELREKVQQAEDRQALNAVKLAASRGEIALTQMRYADAAERFRQAASLVPAGNSQETSHRHQRPVTSAPNCSPQDHKIRRSGKNHHRTKPAVRQQNAAKR